MKALFLLLIVFSVSKPPSENRTSFVKTTFNQALDWSNATHWKVYSIPDRKSAAFPLDTLYNFKSRQLDQDSMRYYLTNVKLVTVKGPPLWQGYIIATCELNHVPQKLILSVYGGFFFDPAGKKYYEIENDPQLRRNWHTYLLNSLKAADPHALIP